jgi:pyrroline-5-carboxylate reductase
LGAAGEEIMSILHELSFTLIGAGNIGRILLKRLLEHGVTAEHLSVCDSDTERAQLAADEFGVRTATLDNADACGADVLLLAVPPKAISAVVRQIRELLRSGQTLISFAAGIPIAHLERLLPPGIAVVRVMPNAPSLVGEGMNPVAYGSAVSPEQRAIVEALLATLGVSLEVRDEQMNWCVGLSGAAMRSLLPALEGMAQAGMEAGLAPQDARRLAAQVMLGTAALVLRTELSFDEIKSLTPMQTVDEVAVASLYLNAARSAMEQIKQMQSKWIGA